MEGKDLLAELEKEYQDTCSILENDNANISDPSNRYNIQHLEGSSEENSEAGSDNEGDGEVDYGYAALEEDDEFGDFKGFEEDGNNEINTDFLANKKQDQSQELFPLAPPANTSKSVIQEEQTTTPPVPPTPSIPPLSQEKIDKIKLAMSKMTIKPPPLGTAELLKEFDRCKLRLGDEASIKQQK